MTAGTRLGPYEILAPIGAGGMGEVWKARDTRLDRTVAIKILPAQSPSEPQHRERFLREARAVSNLSHPHICTLHDIGAESGVEYLVLEYLDGETLQQRLRRGALPREQALRYGIEVADALDQAHRNQVVHRDLKPANVMLTRSGAKILDFGLAKTTGPSRGIGDGETLTNALTSPGVVVGTLHYMAPEQLEGKEAGVQSDIFAFGALLYEMLTGRRAFSGDSSAGVAASILTADPPAAAEIPSGSSLDRVVRKCVAKDPGRRWQTAADLKDELEWINSFADTPSTTYGRRRRAWWAMAAAVLAVLAAGLAWRNRPAPTEQAIWHLAIPPPADTVYAFGETDAMAISPDGAMLAFPVLTPKGSQLWIRNLRTGSEKALQGTEGARGPFWSPDSRFIGYFAGGKLMKVGLSGAPEVICNAGESRGGSWNRDGVIIFTPRSLSVVHRVSASGGEPVEITTLDPARGENAHYWPHFLPDGRHFLYWARNTNDYTKSGIFVAALDDNPKLTGRPLVVATPTAAVYSTGPNTRQGYLLFVRAKSLVAQILDLSDKRLTGESFRVVENIATVTGNAMTFTSVSSGRVLVYTKSEKQTSRLMWRNRTGGSLGDAAPQGMYQDVRVAKDGRTIIVIRHDEEIGQNIWAVASGGGMTRLSLNPALARTSPAVSPDGMTIAFAQPGERAISLFTIPFTGSTKPKQLHPTLINQYPEDWSPDGRHLLFRQASSTTQQDLWVLPLEPGARPFPIISTPSREVDGRISPDGRWIAYASDHSGSFEIYVQSFTALVAGAQSRPSGRFQLVVDWLHGGVEMEKSSSTGYQPELCYRVP